MAKCKFYRPYFDTLKKIVGGYYQLDGCCSGGPLHILLDDDNYDIGSIHFCIDRCFEQFHKNVTLSEDGKTINMPYINMPYNKEVCTLGIMICNEYAKMSLKERAAFDHYLSGRTLECKCPGSCWEDCDVFGELYEYMKEAEER